jgi:3-hydroxyacyl-[acyl-carrier-protein] dehydratase
MVQYPGDQLRIEVVKEWSRGLVWKFQGTAKVNDKGCSAGRFRCMVQENT